MCESRIALHKEAKLLMQSSAWQKALTLLYRARAEFGDNLLLLVDQAACEYMDGSIYSWRKTLGEIESALEQNRSILSQNTLYNALLFLGKFAEEEGHFKKAISLYEAIANGSFDDRQISMAQAQLVRVYSLFGTHKSALSRFTDLSAKLRAYKSEGQRIEILHALMLADLELIGPESGIERYDIAISMIACESDRALLFYDLAEGVLVSDSLGELREQLVSRLAGAPIPDNAFEKAVHSVLEGKPITFAGSLMKMDQMSVMLQLRLANLVHKFGATEGDRSRASRLASVLLSSFDNLSSRSLIERFNLGSCVATQTIEIHDSTIRYQERSISWSKRPTAIALLKALSSGEAIDVEKVVQAVWQAEFNASYSDRLRVLVRRINSDLQTFVSKPEVLVIRNGRVALSEGVRFNVRVS